MSSPTQATTTPVSGRSTTNNSPPPRTSASSRLHQSPNECINLKNIISSSTSPPLLPFLSNVEMVTTTEKHLSKGHQEVFVSPGCKAKFYQHKIMTDTSITFPVDVIHFEWVWDQIKITNFMDPTDLPTDLVKLAETGISRPTLADLQFMALTKQKISEMVKPEDWGLSFIHTLGSGTLGVCLIIIAVFIAYKCYKNAKAQIQILLRTSRTSISSTAAPLLLLLLWLLSNRSLTHLLQKGPPVPQYISVKRQTPWNFHMILPMIRLSRNVFDNVAKISLTR